MISGVSYFLLPTCFILSPMHLYVHVPFCKRRCSYCDFAIAGRKQMPGGEFVEAIKREFALRHLALSRAQGIETSTSAVAPRRYSPAATSPHSSDPFARRSVLLNGARSGFLPLEKPMDPYRTRTCP